MRIHRLTLCNFACFRGENTIELGAQVYAVTARHHTNPERSNWLGKTTFLESIDFALYGNHRYSKEDQWINREEKEGYVELETDDGLIIRRSRIRGKSTQLKVTDGNRHLAKDEAEAHIIQRIGLDSKDFRNTSYFEQRKMSRFVTTDPGERMNIIGSWFRLEPLQKCAQDAKDKANTLSDLLLKLEADLAGKTAYVEQNFQTAVGTGYPVEGAFGGSVMQDLLREKEEAVKCLTQEVEAADQAVAAMAVSMATQQKDAEDSAEYHRIVSRGKALKTQITSLMTDLAARTVITDEEIARLYAVRKEAEAAVSQAHAEWSKANAEKAQKEKLKAGEFDGLCPVAGIQCPARDEINAPRKRNLALFNEAASKEQSAKEAYAVVKNASTLADNAHSQANQAKQKASIKFAELANFESNLVNLRTDAMRLTPASKRHEDASSHQDDSGAKATLQSLRAKLLEASTSVGYLKRSITAIEGASAQIVTTRSLLEATKLDLAVAREAVQVFGRNGAQKSIAEGALGDIETGANELLSTCGIDLTIGVQWAREGDGLASDCDTCGTPFPSSARVKKCTRCGMERGPKIINKLDINLSDKSGAAEDLAGISFQLAASAWLRADRGSAWGSSLIDEPFTALDTANRKALATHFATMLRGSYGYEQSFIVAHQKDIMESLPARIEIYADGTGSKLRVIG